MPISETIQRATLFAKLRRAAIFEGLSDAEMTRVAGYCEISRVAKGEVIFREGERVTGFYIVSRGVIQAFRRGAAGNEQLIHLVHAGESFAEAALTSENGYPASSRALEDSEVVKISKQPFFEHLQDCPALALRMLASLSRRLHGLVATIETFQLRDTESRLLRWLLDRCTAISGPATITVTTTRNVLATELGTRRETLSRLLGRLREDGALEVRGRQITIADTAGLRLRLEGRLKQMGGNSETTAP